MTNTAIFHKLLHKSKRFLVYLSLRYQRYLRAREFVFLLPFCTGQKGYDSYTRANIMRLLRQGYQVLVIEVPDQTRCLNCARHLKCEKILIHQTMLKQAGGSVLKNQAVFYF